MTFPNIPRHIFEDSPYISAQVYAGGENNYQLLNS